METALFPGELKWPVRWDMRFHDRKDKQCLCCLAKTLLCDCSAYGLRAGVWMDKHQMYSFPDGSEPPCSQFLQSSFSTHTLNKWLLSLAAHKFQGLEKNCHHRKNVLDPSTFRAFPGPYGKKQTYILFGYFKIYPARSNDAE